MWLIVVFHESSSGSLTMARPRFSIAGVMLTIVGLSIGIAALRAATQLWASLVFTTTLVVLAAAVLRAVHQRGQRRAFWVGFALFGWSYLIIAFGPWFAAEWRSRLITTALAERAFPWIHQEGPSELRFSDQVFIRRTYLDMVGTLPMATEVTAFVADDDFDKRNKLVDRLTSKTPEYAFERAKAWLQFQGQASSPTVPTVASANGLGITSVHRRSVDDLDVRYTRLMASEAAWESFQRIAHCLWALAFATLGGLVARGFSRGGRNEPTAPRAGFVRARLDS